MIKRGRIFLLGRIATVSVLVSLLLVAMTVNALARRRPPDHPFPRSAKLAGIIRGCGGASPGRCGPVTAQVSASKDHSEFMVSGAEHGKFSYRLRPGRYTVVAICNGVKETRQVIERQHQTTRVRFTFHTH